MAADVRGLALSIVVIMSALHAEGRKFEPCSDHFFCEICVYVDLSIEVFEIFCRGF